MPCITPPHFLTHAALSGCGKYGECHASVHHSYPHFPTPAVVKAIRHSFTLSHTSVAWCIQVRTGTVVAEGAELFASYVNPEASRSVRRAHLLQRYGFECRCAKCEAEAAD